MDPTTSLYTHLKFKEYAKAHEHDQEHNLNHIHYKVREDIDYQHTLILIHGNRISSKYWGPLKHELHHLKPLRTVAIDLRGFGKSNAITKLNSLDEFADDVHALVHHLMKKDDLDQEDVRDNFTLVGWSLGGVVTMMLAAKYPTLYQRIVLISPGPISGYPVFKVDEHGKITNIKCETREEIESHPYIKTSYQSSQNQDLDFFKQLAHNKWYNAGPKPHDDLINNLVPEAFAQTNYLDTVWTLHNYDLTEDVKKNVVGPVLLYHGKQDQIVPFEKAQEIFEVLGPQRCHFVAIEDMGHMPPTSTPHEVAKEILKFIS